MSVSPGSLPPRPAPAVDAGARALIAAMEDAPSAIFCLTKAEGEPVWANARARALGSLTENLPLLDGRPVAEVVEEVLTTGRPGTLHGTLASDGSPVTVITRPLNVAGEPGVLLVLEPALRHEDVVELAQHSLLPPSLPLLPHLWLSGSYHRASSGWHDLS